MERLGKPQHRRAGRRPSERAANESISEYSRWHAITTFGSISSRTRTIPCSTSECTNDLARRGSEHRSGEIHGFTSAYRCHKLLYYEHYTDVQDAITRETQLQKWSRRKKVALIGGLNRSRTILRQLCWEKSKRCLGFARHDKVPVIPSAVAEWRDLGSRCIDEQALGRLSGSERVNL
jgi:predicted GIY-YIG superfamily endonuclease